MNRRQQSSLRLEIATEAARILADHHGDLDYQAARQKAARRLGCSNDRQLPNNSEIEMALQRHLSIFTNTGQPAALKRLRKLAVEAMQSLASFNPRLIGPVLSGTASSNSPIQLHLFPETPEEVMFHLMDKNIPWVEKEAMLRFSNGSRERRPVLHFLAGDTEIELYLLKPPERRNPPLSRIDERPERGAPLNKLLEMLEQDQR
ncbi:hypothetical protein [Solemya velesiana gill symbiont]|uniref:Uncharacterized protein n=1 Tax=Solemya velesiana gill symbiont TaxID=1918948 RepID=A0A1T2KYC2_9GAMM|nr:hypothetical protein [Solemya velesiana gill symbiont]OOZ37845.1 hypothetical protein BOW51_00085 [Solemya velesiana gill symbiont]